MPAQFVATQQRAMAMRNARRARFLVRKTFSGGTDMEKSKKIISLLLALIMTLSVFTIVPFSAGAAQADVSPAGATETDVSPAGAPESYTDIHVGDRLYPIELNSGETTYFKFVPERNMRIFFYTRFSIFSIAFLYDAQMNQLKSGNSFNLFYDVTAGDTYYFGV